jgi:hypothetical protein
MSRIVNKLKGITSLEWKSSRVLKEFSSDFPEKCGTGLEYIDSEEHYIG